MLARCRVLAAHFGMGTWGPGIFSNDTACDVRVAYRMALEEGLDDQAAQQQVLEQFAAYLDDEVLTDGPLVWLALAKTQWQLGRLDNHVNAEALAVIDQGRDLVTWEGSDVYGYRRAVLRRLRQQLTTRRRHASRSDRPAAPTPRSSAAGCAARRAASFSCPARWSQRPRAGQPAGPWQWSDRRPLLRPGRRAALGAAASPHGACAAFAPRAHRPLPRRLPAPTPLAGARPAGADRLVVLAAAALRPAPEHG
jgi:hypothetical protein